MRRTRLPLLLALAAVASAARPCPAAKVKVWHHNAPGHYEKAQLRQAVVSNEGVLRLARRLRPLANLDAAHVWDLAEDRDGNLYAATGDEGRIYKVTPDGKAVVAHACEAGQVLCLAVAGDGTVYAGTGPTARVVRLDPRGAARVLCELPENYVWSLALDPKSGDLYAGTGPHGRIYRVTPDGKAAVYYATKRDHVLSVATGADGTLYAGTDKGGLIYRFDAKGKGFVLFQAAQGEVRALKVTPEALYAGTSATGRRRAGGTASGGSDREVASRKTEEADDGAAPAKGPRDGLAASSGSKSAAKDAGETAKASPAPAPAAPSAGENSVYRITPDGAVREVFREKTLVMSLLPRKGRLYVGAGTEGQLFEVDQATRERNEAARLDHGQVLCLLERRDGSTVVGTGDPGRLYVLQDGHAAKGTVTSEVLDAKLVSKWGALRWEADTPEGTRVGVAVRSGNVAEPDETWSDWSAEQSDPQRAVVAAPPARYLQYRLTLASGEPAVAPAVRGLTLRYATTNQAPELTKLEVPDLNAVNLDNPKKLKLKWSATDSNEDELTYDLYVKKDGWSNWVQMEDDFDKTELEWDATTTPSGVYRLKVVASDRRDNAEGDALTGERVSAPFVVSHEPPEVAARVAGFDGDRAVIEASAAAPLARLTSATYAVDGKKWVNVFPADGLFDSKGEKFRFKTEGLKAGTHVLVIKVRDAAGNTGSADVVFSVPAKAVLAPP